MKWYSLYNHENNKYFINQFNSCFKKSLPPFLDNNPDVKEAIVTYCNNNLINLTASEVQEFIISTCLPQLVKTRKEEANNNSITIETILNENKLKSITGQTVS